MAAPLVEVPDVVLFLHDLQTFGYRSGQVTLSFVS